jgi:hypothetical protein
MRELVRPQQMIAMQVQKRFWSKIFGTPNANGMCSLFALVAASIRLLLFLLRKAQSKMNCKHSLSVL